MFAEFQLPGIKIYVCDTFSTSCNFCKSYKSFKYNTLILSIFAMLKNVYIRLHP